MDKFQPILLLAAMEEEITYILRQAEDCKHENVGNMTAYRCRFCAQEMVIACSGIGMLNASIAVETLIQLLNPGLIISIGFCGAVLPGLCIGDAVYAERLFSHDGASLHEEPLIHQNILRAENLLPGTFISSNRILDKREVGKILPVDIVNPVLEMETTAVFAAASRHGISCAGIRTVSDDAIEELAFTLDDLTDETQKISITRVIYTSLKKPWVIKQLLRLRQNSQRAAKTLAEALSKALPLLALTQ